MIDLSQASRVRKHLAEGRVSPEVRRGHPNFYVGRVDVGGGVVGSEDGAVKKTRSERPLAVRGFADVVDAGRVDESECGVGAGGTNDFEVVQVDIHDGQRRSWSGLRGEGDGDYNDIQGAKTHRQPLSTHFGDFFFSPLLSRDTLLGRRGLGTCIINHRGMLTLAFVFASLFLIATRWCTPGYGQNWSIGSASKPRLMTWPQLWVAHTGVCRAHRTS